MTRTASDLIVIASAKAKPGKERDLQQALLEAAGPTRKQPGCVEFTLLRRQDDGSTLIGFERWASVEDHQRHLRGAHVERLMARMGEILAEPPMIVTYAVADEAR
jgi:quinol monooxygenase YgiN